MTNGIYCNINLFQYHGGDRGVNETQLALLIMLNLNMGVHYAFLYFCIYLKIPIIKR